MSYTDDVHKHAPEISGLIADEGTRSVLLVDTMYYKLDTKLETQLEMWLYKNILADQSVN